MTYEDFSVPYAVYGSLRPGCGNDSIWHGMADLADGLWFVDDFRLVSHRNGWFPFALPFKGGRIVANLLLPFDSCKETLRATLDTLEGFPSFYNRYKVNAYNGERSVKAWLYVPFNYDDYVNLPHVPDGDWQNFLVNAG